MACLGWIFWRGTRTCLIVNLILVRLVPDVIDVLVSLSSVVTEFCGGFSCCSDWDFVEPQSFSFSKKRAHSCTVMPEEMWFEEPQVKVPPMSRRRMRPSTPLQNSHSSFEEEQVNFEVEDQQNSTSTSEELEPLLGPDDTEVNFRRVLEEARDEKGCQSFAME